MEANLGNILDSLARRVGEGVVFVHGGGDVVSRFERALGIEPKIVVSPSGIRSRLTDEKEIEVYNMVMSGKIGKEISAYLNHRGVTTISLSGVDAGIIRAERKKRIIIVDERGRKRVIEGGYTGTIKEVNGGVIKELTERGILLVVSPVALGLEGELLNVDGDATASAIAKELKASKLILLTDVEGVIIDNQLIRRLSVMEAKALLEKIGPGMNRKVMHAVEAVEYGVGQAVICSGYGEDPLANAEVGRGTVIEK